ncbi:hypothetical protein HDU81_004641 [Chytriomyces hyalinus]|nr:hypothetical protein HDU81_004641 [Chytriomyces hyalinus]
MIPASILALALSWVEPPAVLLLRAVCREWLAVIGTDSFALRCIQNHSALLEDNQLDETDECDPDTLHVKTSAQAHKSIQSVQSMHSIHSIPSIADSGYSPSFIQDNIDRVCNEMQSEWPYTSRVGQSGKSGVLSLIGQRAVGSHTA